MLLSISKIRLNGGTQTREAINYNVVEEYTERYREGLEMDPVGVVYDGQEYWLYDGFHRVSAAQSAHLDEINVEVKNGDREYAVWLAAAANAKHGLKRTNADKRRAVTSVLALGSFAGKSDREIAEHCGVSHTFVAELRGNRCQSASHQPDNGKKKRSETNQKKQAREQEERMARERAEENKRQGAAKAREARAVKLAEKQQREQKPAPVVEVRSEAYAIALRGLTTSLHSHTIEALLSLGPVERNALWDDLRRHHESKKQAA
jgi:ParB-like chromosome segregation protein Spo0J